MKASEAIRQLACIISENGDLEVDITIADPHEGGAYTANGFGVEDTIDGKKVITPART